MPALTPDSRVGCPAQLQNQRVQCDRFLDIPPQQIGKLKLVTADVPMNRGTDGLFRADAGDLNADPAARLQSGALEGSNVSPVATMVGMIAAARQFEHQMKMLENAEKQDQTASKLLSEN